MLTAQAKAMDGEASAGSKSLFRRVLPVLAGILAGLGIAALFFLRSNQTANADKRICGKVDHLTSALINFTLDQPPPTDPLQRIQRHAFVEAMRKAACDPRNLPSTRR